MGPTTYQLLRTVEIDLELGGETIAVRVELFRNRANRNRYRARLWRRDLFRLKPSFPQDDAGEPTLRADSELFVEWSDILRESYDDFTAASDEAAEDKIVDDLRQALAGASNTF